MTKNSEKALISIIVPIYNTDKYLDKCIKSILNQTHQNIELILVDDGSNDTSAEICKSYLKKDDRIIYIAQENAGAAAARNKGLEIFNGDYVGFVDSDDYIDTDFYETLFKAMQENNADVGQILSRRITDGGSVINKELIIKTEGLPCIVYNSDQAIEHYLIGNHSLWSHLYHRLLFDKLRIPEGMTGEDLAIVIPLYSRSKKIVKINEYKYNYRLNFDSVTNSPMNERTINLLFEFERQLDLYSNNELYQNILVHSISKILAGILNSLILGTVNQLSIDERFLKDKLIHYFPTFKNNPYISIKQIRKYEIYLKKPFLYKILLKLKRTYHRSALYGEE